MEIIDKQIKAIRYILSNQADLKALEQLNDGATEEDFLKQVIKLQISTDICGCGHSFENYLSGGCDASEDSAFIRWIRNGSCNCLPKEGTSQQLAGLYLIHIAACCGNVEAVKNLVNLGCDIDSKTLLRKNTPLLYAMKLSDAEDRVHMVQCLIDLKCDVSSASDYDLAGRRTLSAESPLYIAIHYGYLSEMRLLIDAGCDVNAKSHYNALLTAIANGDKQTLQILIDAGFNVKSLPDAITKVGHPLSLALANNHTDIFEMLLEAGCPPDPICKYNFRQNRLDIPLIAAIDNGYPEMCLQLLKAGANPNLSEDGDFPCIFAAFFGEQYDCLKHCLDYGADVNIPSQNNYRLIHYAAWDGHLDLVKRLIAAGAVYDTQTADRNTPLALACHGNQKEVVTEFLKYDCNVNNSDKDMDTPLLYCAFNGCVESVKELLVKGADPHWENSRKVTPLWNAVYSGSVEVTRELLQKNVKLNVPSRGIDQKAQGIGVTLIYPEPRTPLYVACDQDHHKVVILLLYGGVDISQEGWFWREPSSEISPQIIDLLNQEANYVTSLKMLCRNTLRQYFGRRLTESVPMLEIPLDLKDCLLLKDARCLFGR